MNITSPLTGAAQTGLTSPTYTLTTDTAPYPNGKQWQVTALGGTQPGVTANSIGNPFTLSYYRPPVIKLAQAVILNAVGFISNAPKNSFKWLTRKATPINALSGTAMITLTTQFDVPVGCIEAANGLAELKAAISAHIGGLEQDLDQWFENIQSGGL